MSRLEKLVEEELTKLADAVVCGPDAEAKQARDSFNVWSQELRSSLSRASRDTTDRHAKEGETFVLALLAEALKDASRYDSRTRFLLQKVSAGLGIPPSTFTSLESSIATTICETYSRDAQTAGVTQYSTHRAFKIGLGALAGGIALGVTGGLAAPLLAGAVGGLFGTAGAAGVGTLVGSLIGNAALVGVVFGGYGYTRGRDIVRNRTKEVSDFDIVPLFEGAPTKVKPLHVTIGVSGWLRDRDDITRPWICLGNPDAEVYAVQWEVEALMNLGKALYSLVRSQAFGYVKSYIIRRTIFASLSAALWPLGLLQAGKLIDNDWSNAASLASRAGPILADVLQSQPFGRRPVNLVGFSLGARIIVASCVELDKRGEYGIVGDVVIAGAAVPAGKDTWEAVRRAAGGRVVNCYSGEDWLLGLVYRMFNLQLDVAGLQAISGVSGVESYDISCDLRPPSTSPGTTVFDAQASERAGDFAKGDSKTGGAKDLLPFVSQLAYVTRMQAILRRVGMEGMPEEPVLA